ncbi:uncharacterized protein H6S33_003306 [Morchella sextelata]|uniref:uncharacterized protein n=1 Tax=Morchella sextelata TaxID=1174677 RepID=UPI001D042C8A|nr:uncharacterized protein H6S33_003306 [Morchella sextelata]KAH0607318.1 hypothetical protein H6S33_003306 [Morchella sextelata]
MPTPKHLSTLIILATLVAYAAAQDNTACSLSGNPDLYGLGIRIGFYSQLVATCFANTFIPSETRGAQTVNLWFQFSLFVGLIFQAAREGTDFYAAESYIVVILLSGVVFTTFSYFFIYLAISRDDDENGIFGGAVFTMICFIILLAGLHSYSLWFWWRGMDRMGVGPCSTYGFFMARVDLFGWFRTVNKVFNIWMMAALILGCISLVIVFTMIAVSESQLLSSRKKEENFVLDEIERSIADRSTGKSICRISVSLPEKFCSECSLRWNQVSGVGDLDSVGQLIPFVVGIGTLLQIFKNIYLQARRNWKKQEKGTRSFKTLFFHFLDPHTGDGGEDAGGTIELDPVTTSVQSLSPASRSVTSVTSTAHTR